MATQSNPPAGRRLRRKPESLRVRAVSPALTVADLQKSLVWYRDVLGFLVEETWEDNGRVSGVSLKAGTSSLMLSQDDWKKGVNRVKGEGIRIYLSTAQNADDVANAIKARGGKLASEPTDTPWGERVFTVVDPDGYKFTIASDSE
jgi:uncharacterized glyoxalase superfamily protein PhnB